MEHSWTEFRPLKNPQEGDTMRVQTINRIRLFGAEHDYKVKFNCEDKVGKWRYIWGDVHGPIGYYMIEFKASHTQANTRRHCLRQTTENTFELLAPEHPVYKRNDIWECEHVHQNKFPIVMQRLHVPSLPYERTNPQSGD